MGLDSPVRGWWCWCWEVLEAEQLIAAVGKEVPAETLTGTRCKAGSREFPLPPVFPSPSTAPYWQSSPGKAEVSAMSQLFTVKSQFEVETYRTNNCH